MAEKADDSSFETQCDLTNTSVWIDHPYTCTRKLHDDGRVSQSVASQDSEIHLDEMHLSKSLSSPTPLKLIKLDTSLYVELNQEKDVSNYQSLEQDMTEINVNLTTSDTFSVAVLQTHSVKEPGELLVENFTELPFVTDEEQMVLITKICEQDIKKLNRKERRKLKKNTPNVCSSLQHAEMDSTTWSELPFAAELKVPGEDEKPSNKIKINKKRRKKTKSTSNDEVEDKIKRPNYFVAIQINNPEITENVRKVQDHVVEKNKALKKALISLATLHITLAVMHLEITDLQGAFEAIKICTEKLSKDLANQPLSLQFHGLEHFSSGVLFAKIKEGEELNLLKTVANVIQESFVTNGIPVSDKDFQAHLTILKRSKLPWKTKKVFKKIQTDLYKDYKDLFFGNQTISSLQLLSMTDPKDDNGYYHCLKEITFTTNK